MSPPEFDKSEIDVLHAAAAQLRKAHVVGYHVTFDPSLSRAARATTEAEQVADNADDSQRY